MASKNPVPHRDTKDARESAATATTSTANSSSNTDNSSFLETKQREDKTTVDESTTYALVTEFSSVRNKIDRTRKHIQEVQKILDSTYLEFLGKAKKYCEELTSRNVLQKNETILKQIEEIKKLIALMQKLENIIKKNIAESEENLAKSGEHLDVAKILQSKNNNLDDAFIYALQAYYYSLIFHYIYNVILKIYNPNEQVSQTFFLKYNPSRPVHNGIEAVAQEILYSIFDHRRKFFEFHLVEAQLLKFASELGNSEAAVSLGNIYASRENYKDAFEYYILAANGGNSQAMYCVGCFYFKGLGVEPDQKIAAEFFEKAIQDPKNIHLKALIALGDCFFYGYGKQKDQEKAFELYTRAQKAGIYKATVKLGRCYKTGAGVAQNSSMALKLFVSAVDYGDVEAFVERGLCYSQGIGVSVTEDSVNKEAVIKEHAAKQFMLAYEKARELRRVEGLNLICTEESTLHQNYQHLRELLLRALDLGYLKSLEDLARFHMEHFVGRWNPHEDHDYATELKQLYAERFLSSITEPIEVSESLTVIECLASIKINLGDMSAAYIHMLGLLKRSRLVMDLIGTISSELSKAINNLCSELMPKDFPRGDKLNLTSAIDYLAKRALTDDAAALGALGFAYQYGFGVITNIEVAFFYYLRALEKNNFYCLKRLWLLFLQVPRMESLGKLLEEGCRQWIKFAQERYWMSEIHSSPDEDSSSIVILRNRLRDAHALLGRINETPGQFHSMLGAAEHFEQALKLDPQNIGLVNRHKVFQSWINIRNNVVAATQLPNSIFGMVAEYANPWTQVENPRLGDRFWISQNQEYIKKLLRIDRKMVEQHQAKLIAKARAKQSMLFSDRGTGHKENERRVRYMRVINGIMKMANAIFNSPEPLSGALERSELLKEYFVLRLNIIRAAHARAVEANREIKLLADKKPLGKEEIEQRNKAMATFMHIIEDSWHLVQVTFEPIQTFQTELPNGCPNEEDIEALKLPEYWDYGQLVRGTAKVNSSAGR